MKTANTPKLFLLIAACFAAVILTAVAFLPCLNNGFTNWDDNVYITETPMVRTLAPDRVGDFFTARFVNDYHDYHPLTLISYAVDYAIGGLNPFVYHATNLILHLGNTLMVLWLVLGVSGCLPAAFLTALFFGIHPLHVESVAWVAERKDVLSTFFYLGSCIAYDAYARNGKPLPYAVAVVATLLSFLSKSMAITIPIVLFLYDYLRGRKLTAATVAEKIPFIVLAAVFTIVTTLIHHPEGGITLKSEYSYSFVRSVFVAGHALIFYLWKSLYPADLSCLYPYPPTIESAIPFAYLISPVIAAAIAGIFLWRCSSDRRLLFGFFFFLITIGPLLQIVPTTWTVAADRYMYLPSVGLFYIGCAGYVWITARAGRFRKVCHAVLCVIIGTFIVLTQQRCSVWKNSVTLWTDVIRQYPFVPNIWNSRGSAYSESGSYAKAIEDFTAGIRLHENYPSAYHNRGNAWYALGQYDKALADYAAAIMWEPSYVSAYNNRANVYVAKRMFDEALADYSKAIELNPRYANAYANRAYLRQLTGDMDGSMNDLAAAIAVEPANPDTYFKRAAAFFRQEKHAEAIADYSRAIELGMRSHIAYVNRGYILHLAGDRDGAMRDLDHALQLAPDDFNAHLNRGIVFHSRGEFAKASDDFTKAILQNPLSSLALNNRGNSLVALGRLDEAIADYSRAIELNGAYPDAYNNRGIAHLLKKEYGKASADFQEALRLGFRVNPAFIEESRRARQ
ncbi:MAG TPA: tetratricopeptide repeat protein [bacterium]|nr:tetratricopeptide repeat protein [bacterium]